MMRKGRRRKIKAIVECYDELELFKNMLIDEFLRLCNYNDYNKLTLLKIGDVVDECFDKSIETIKNMRKEDKEQWLHQRIRLDTL